MWNCSLCQTLALALVVREVVNGLGASVALFLGLFTLSVQRRECLGKVFVPPGCGVCVLMVWLPVKPCGGCPAEKYVRVD
eukprot:scaffold128458_cov34-Prasinocladus_malaysianus.AAC.1